MTAGFTCAHGHATGHRRLCARACASAAMHARNLFRAGLNTAAWCRGRINGGAHVISESQLVSSRGASTTVSIPAEATKAGEGRGPFNAKRLTLYSGAALLAVSSVAAVSAQQRTVKQDAHPSALLEAPWVQAIPQQQDVLQVLSAESIATHPLLSQDHLVSILASKVGTQLVQFQKLINSTACSLQPCYKRGSWKTWSASTIQRRISTILSFSLASKLTRTVLVACACLSVTLRSCIACCVTYSAGCNSTVCDLFFPQGCLWLPNDSTWRSDSYRYG